MLFRSYEDHCKTYSVTRSGTRPIYWMVSSPKGTFKALIYTHRYTRDTFGTVLTDYLRPLHDKLAAQAEVLARSKDARDKRIAASYESQVKELEDWERDVVYPLAQAHVEIDLDDGVEVNYNKFPRALSKVSKLSSW